jgi:hypothetical protein
MLDNLAPIGISAYVRLQHLQICIAALQKNTLAEQSELFVFSDGPKPGDEVRVAVVRAYLQTVDGFKEVHIIERESNSRTSNNRGGIEELLNIYGKTIFLEEDVVTAPGFLQYMNDALDFYKDNPSIGSITAYCPPIKIPATYPNDVFALTRFNPWGMGLWKRYYRMNTPISENEYLKLFNDKKRTKMLARSVGQEALPIIRMDFEGKLDAGDMKSIFWQFVDGKLTIYPRKSLVHNIGQDGSGFHMGVTDKWDISDVWNKVRGFEFVRDISVDENIRQEHYNFYKTRYADAKGKIIGYLVKIGIYQYLRPIFKKIQHQLKRSYQEVR